MGDILVYIVGIFFNKGEKVMSNNGARYSVKQVANWFLKREKMDQKKLQKMCYFAYSWFLYYFNDSVNDLNVRLFENDIQGWVHGPVSVTLYKAFPFKGMECLEPLNGVDDIPVTDKQTIGVLEEVYDVYKDFSGNELEAMTHKQDPWIESRESLEPYEPGKKYLKDETIFRYFCHLADA